MSANPAPISREHVLLAALGPALELTAGLTAPLRVEGEIGGVAYQFVAVPVGQSVPPVGRRRRGERGEKRWAAIKLSVLAALRAEGCPLTRRQLVNRLKAAGTPCPSNTLGKVLGEMTAKDHSLVNLDDKRGYRLPEWPVVVRKGKKDLTPSLFDRPPG